MVFWKIQHNVSSSVCSTLYTTATAIVDSRAIFWLLQQLVCMCVRVCAVRGCWAKVIVL